MPNDDPFDSPGSGDLFDWGTHHGRLLLITPHSHERGITTQYGDSDAIRADIVVLAEPGTGPAEVMQDTLIFPRVIQSRIRGNVGTQRMTLGRLEQGPAEKGNPPWILTDPDDQDRATARAYLKPGQASSTRATATAPVQARATRPAEPPF